MTITTINDNERRLIGEAKVLRDLLAEANNVITTLEGECITEEVMLRHLQDRITAALTPPEDRTTFQQALL